MGKVYCRDAGPQSTAPELCQVYFPNGISQRRFLARDYRLIKYLPM